MLLSKLLLNVIISETFGQYADRRLIHAALDKTSLKDGREQTNLSAELIAHKEGVWIDYIADFARRGLKRRGLELLGVVPHHNILSRPTLRSILEELQAETLNDSKELNNLVEDVVVGAMSAHNAIQFFQPGVLVITPGDREDLILAAAATLCGKDDHALAGMVLTGNLRPGENVMKIIQEMNFPVLLAKEDSYEIASKVHDLIVKTRPDDLEKISVIRDLIGRHVDVKKILQLL